MPSEVVVVTGASGYIACHLVQQLLEKGYTVRGTVRDPTDSKKTGCLLKLPGAAERLKLFKADLLDEGSFDEACKGAAVVFHTASPFVTRNVTNPQTELVDPAVKGTTNVLSSVNKANSVRRVVLTSSVAAIYHAATDKPDGAPFTEEDWNTLSTLENSPYPLSKTLAERAAWDEAKKQSRWTLVTINPGLVMGPTLSGRDDATSISLIRDLLTGRFKFGAPRLDLGIVDVRDVAKAHVLAAEVASASGRYQLVERTSDFVGFSEVFAKRGEFPLPTRYLPNWLVYTVGPWTAGLSFSFLWNNLGVPMRFDSSKVKRELKLEFIPMDKSLNDMLDSLIQFKIVTPP